jgi:hypothetical protein
MSLLDMINWMLFTFVEALRTLTLEIDYAAQCSQVDAVVKEGDRQRLIASLNSIAIECRKLDLVNAENRFRRILPIMQLHSEVSYAALVSELNILRQAIEDDTRSELFYYYPRQKAALLLSVDSDWRIVMASFPSAKGEIEAGVDCFCMEHNSACVFHMMRVAEIGMRALARERQVTFPRHPLEWAEWENIIDQIESKARDATTGMPRGHQRDAARAFYTAAVAQLRAFKETRNRIMHMRGGFDELDAQRAINQVRDFMNGLSAKIGEKTRKPIPLSRWP